MGSPRTLSRYGRTLTRQTYRAKLRQMRREQTRELLPLITLASGLILIVLSPFPLFVFEVDHPWLLAALPAATGLTFLALRAGLITPRMDPRFAIPAAFGLAISILANIGTHMVLTLDPHQSTYLLLLVLGAGFLVASFAALVMVSAASLGIFIYVWVLAEGGTDWIHFGISLFLATAVAFLFYFARDNTVRNSLTLRLRQEHHMTSMARSIQATNESEVRFRRLSESAFEGIILHDKGRVLDANDSAAEMAGLPRAALIGQSLSELVHVKDGTGIEGLLLAPPDRPTEHWIQRRDGEDILLEVRGRKIPYRGSEAHVLALRDLTATRRLETERLRLATRLERILASAGEGVFGVDHEGRCTFINGAALEALGYRNEEVLGRVIDPLIHGKDTPGDGHPVEGCPIGRAYLEGRPGGSEHEVFWRRDGTSFPVLYRANPIDEAGETTGAVVVFHDISERLEVERMKDELVSIVSHELKTPLTSIHGSLRLLSAGRVGALPPQAARMVAIAEKNTDRLMRLISDILDIERLQAGKSPLRRSLVALPVLIEEAAETMAGLAHDEKVRLRTARIPGLTLFCDRDRAMQCLTNLLSNAIKFSPVGTEVEVEAAERSGWAEVSVKDRGPGVPEAMGPRLFQRFSQSDSSDVREKGGTGLGLAIAKEIVERHGGAIGYHARPGGGSVFWFKLPLAEEPAQGVTR